MGAVVAEQYVGRVKTVIYSSGVYSCGLVTLFLTSLRFSQDAGISLPGLILALFFIGIGTGGIKANMSSLIAEQYTGPEAVIRVLKSGEKVVVDGELTLQRYAHSKRWPVEMLTVCRMFNTLIFYINVGSFAAFATTLIEQKYGFSSAFALSTIVFLIGFVIALANQGHYICNEPENSLIFDVCRALWIAIKHKCDLNNARPTVQAEESPHQRLLPDGSFVDDLEKILSACKVFCLYPFFWAAYSQFQTNFISQAATMETHGIPNDMMTNINPIATLILLPALDRIIFPWLSNRGVPIHHANRMTVGFMFGGLAMLYASLIQQKIYRAPPCYDHPRAQNCLDGRVPNSVSVLFQVPAYVLITSSEVLASVAGIEYAYTKAPKTMKSLITSVYLSTMSVGVLLAMTVSPLTVDPKLPWMYFIIGVGTLMAGIILRCAPL